MITKHEISQIQSDSKFKAYKDLGLIDELALRNLKIKLEYCELRKTHNQIESIFILSEKYNRSFDSINTILFRKRNLKPITFCALPHALGSKLHALCTLPKRPSRPLPSRCQAIIILIKVFKYFMSLSLYYSDILFY